MKIEELRLAGAYLIELSPHTDHRGHFVRTYDRAVFAQHGLQVDWLQEGESYSRRQGTVRGLHYQRDPHGETKLVRVLRGRVWDVIVDVREGSATRGEHLAIELAADDGKLLYIPRGFAHGLCTLTDDSVVTYKLDALYEPRAQAGILWNDPELAIPWPCSDPIISDKDRELPPLRDCELPK